MSVPQTQAHNFKPFDGHSVSDVQRFSMGAELTSSSQPIAVKRLQWGVELTSSSDAASAATFKSMHTL